MPRRFGPLRRFAALLTLAALQAGAGTSASAQDATVLDRRVRVTVTADDGGTVRYAGVATGLEADTLRLVSKGSERAIPGGAIRLLEVSQGRRGHTRVGVLIGAALGVVGGLAAVGEDDGQGSTGAGIIVVPLGAVLYGGLGALVGGLIRTERWKAVPVEQLRRS